MLPSIRNTPLRALQQHRSVSATGREQTLWQNKDRGFQGQALSPPRMPVMGRIVASTGAYWSVLRLYTRS